MEKTYKNLKIIEFLIAVFTVLSPVWYNIVFLVNSGTGFPVIPIYPPIGFIPGMILFTGVRTMSLGLSVNFLFIFLPLILPFVSNKSANGSMLRFLLGSNLVFNLAFLIGVSGWNQETYALVLNLICYLSIILYIIYHSKSNNKDRTLEYQNQSNEEIKKKKLTPGKIAERVLLVVLIAIFLIKPNIDIRIERNNSEELRKTFFGDRSDEIERIGDINLDYVSNIGLKDDIINRGYVRTEVSESEDNGIKPGRYIFIDDGNSFNYLYVYDSKKADKYKERYGYAPLILVELFEGDWVHMESGELIKFSNEIIDKQMELGIFEVGRDLEPGTYKLIPLIEGGGGYYCIYASDTLNVLTEENISNESNIKLEEGQILTISNIIIS